MDVTTAAPAQIDAEIARLSNERAGLDGQIERFANDLKTAAGFARIYLGSRSRGYGFVESLADAEAVLRPLLASGEALPEVKGLYGDVRGRVAGYLATIDAVRAERARLDTEIAPLNAEYDRRGGWTRFFLVNNANGHLHSSTNCSTCYATTLYKWLTDFSGMDEAEIVGEAGDRCCTVCYPSAPVEVSASRRFRSDDEIARDEREAEKARKLDAKREKAIFADDPRAGLELRDDEGRLRGEPKTIIAVERAYGEWAETAHVASVRYRRFSTSEHETSRDRAPHYAAVRDEAERLRDECLGALAARAGVTVDEARAARADKIAKRCAKAYI